MTLPIRWIEREWLRGFVDIIWTEATEGKDGFLGTPERDALIDKALRDLAPWVKGVGK